MDRGEEGRCVGCSHARPIHHAVPAGMRWGQSRTTQLQPVLVCCARHRRVLLPWSEVSLVQLSCFPACVFSQSFAAILLPLHVLPRSPLKLIPKHVFKLNVSISCFQPFTLHLYWKKVSFFVPSSRLATYTMQRSALFDPQPQPCDLCSTPVLVMEV